MKEGESVLLAHLLLLKWLWCRVGDAVWELTRGLVRSGLYDPASGNALFSPLSILTTINMLLLGTTGTTRDQILTTLGKTEILYTRDQILTTLGKTEILYTNTSDICYLYSRLFHMQEDLLFTIIGLLTWVVDLCNFFLFYSPPGPMVYIILFNSISV